MVKIKNTNASNPPTSNAARDVVSTIPTKHANTLRTHIIDIIEFLVLINS